MNSNHYDEQKTHRLQILVSEALAAEVPNVAGRRRLSGGEWVRRAIFPVTFPVTLADTDRAKGLLGRAKGLRVRDAVHAAVMLNNDVQRIATFDRAFDEIPGVTREELMPAGEAR